MTQTASLNSIEKAWNSRFHRWKGYALALTGNATDAEEVVQEAVARTVRARPDLESERDAHNYVLTAVRTAALQLFYKRKRFQPIDNAPLAEEVDIASNPLRIALAREQRDATTKMAARAIEALDLLSPVHQEVVRLLVLREPPMRLREVAEIQGAPVSTVHSRLQSALRLLGRELKDEADGRERVE